jgi:hypothetical protein
VNDTGCIALADTDRDELRERIALAWNRFERLARSAEPLARSSRSDWTVHQIIAHVLTVAHRYRQVACGQDFRRATHARDLSALNRLELDEAMAPVPELIDELQALYPMMDEFFDSCSDDDRAFVFHGGASVSGLTAQTNWLGELLLHGHDIASAAKAHWELPERDMLLVARGVMEIGSGSGYLRDGVSPTAEVCVAFHVPGARPYLMDIRGGTAEIRERRPDDRPDAVLRLSASTLTQMLYQRIGPLGAVRHGLLIVGGRRPWRALKLQSYFEPA